MCSVFYHPKMLQLPLIYFSMIYPLNSRTTPFAAYSRRLFQATFSWRNKKLYVFLKKTAFRNSKPVKQIAGLCLNQKQLSGHQFSARQKVKKNECSHSLSSIWIAMFAGVFFGIGIVIGVPDCSSLKWFNSLTSLRWHQVLICFVLLYSCSESCLFISHFAATFKRNLFLWSLCTTLCVRVRFSLGVYISCFYIVLHVSAKKENKRDLLKISLCSECSIQIELVLKLCIEESQMQQMQFDSHIHAESYSWEFLILYYKSQKKDRQSLQNDYNLGLT